MGQLAGKVAIVTGGARGMGAAMCRLFALEGASVAIADILHDEGEALAKELDPSARFHRHDVADAESWANLACDVEAGFGPIDILVNNAGVNLSKGLLETSVSDFDRVLGVNLRGTFLGLKAVAPGMAARGKGAIVNVASIEAMRGSNSLGAYVTSKWGLRGLTRVAAMELGHRGVRVNLLLPGGTDTVMGNAAGRPRHELDKDYAGIPAQRIGGPEEVAKAALFLASDQASYIFGAELAVDGGMTTGVYYPGMPGAPLNF